MFFGLLAFSFGDFNFVAYDKDIKLFCLSSKCDE